MTKNEDRINCVVDGARGIYVPQSATTQLDLVDWGIDKETISLLENGPDCEWYWEAWDDVLRDAVNVFDGYEWRLYQDGDLFMVREDYDWEAIA